jgi:hypothetical protein
MLSFLLSQSKITPENNLETSTTIIMLGLGISSSTVTYCGSRVSMKWKGPIPAKLKRKRRSEILHRENLCRNSFEEWISRMHNPAGTSSSIQKRGNPSPFNTLFSYAEIFLI